GGGKGCGGRYAWRTLWAVGESGRPGPLSRLGPGGCGGPDDVLRHTSPPALMPACPGPRCERPPTSRRTARPGNVLRANPIVVVDGVRGGGPDRQAAVAPRFRPG